MIEALRALAVCCVFLHIHRYFILRDLLFFLLSVCKEKLNVSRERERESEASLRCLILSLYQLEDSFDNISINGHACDTIHSLFWLFVLDIANRRVKCI